MNHTRIPVRPPENVLAWIRARWTILPELGIVKGIDGKTIGSVRDNGYIQLRAQNSKLDRSVRRTHLIWWAHYGEWPTSEIDHIDRTRTNDRIENLRTSTPARNEANKARYDQLLGSRPKRDSDTAEHSQWLQGESANPSSSNTTKP
jgi:hypothetical protein